ncbi:hypothetical protein SAMN05444266_10995 [Chitinophaga jiangningensis]|uniref:Uncharacterized protein n=1 Tax=Chitinophaga jiangningensis TaxID=1419482 RepID=A0A1M7K1N0_9BACT|nr:hypothetical protein SAMN05444266_10995 [Chitinophaga jiangningensis]
MESITFPVLLAGEGPFTIEVLDSPIFLSDVPMSTIKFGSLINAIVYECNGCCFKIVEISILKRISPWWQSLFGSPLMRVHIQYEKVDKGLKDIKNDILFSITKYPQYWEDTMPINTITQRVNEATSLKDVILFLSGLIYRR